MAVISATGHFGIALLMFAENVFPPIPSELIMPLAGFMAARGELSLAGVVAAGTCGSLLGGLLLYHAGRRLGERRLKDWADRHGRWLAVSRHDIERSQHWFEWHGGAAVFFCHLVPGVRSLISVPAGVGRMRLAPFIFYTAAGGGLWTALLASLGYFLGGNFRRVEEYLDPASFAVFAALAAWYVVRVLRHKGAGRPARQENPSRP